MKNKKIIFLTASLILALISCQKFSDSIKDTLKDTSAPNINTDTGTFNQTYSEEEKTKTPFTSDTLALENAEKDLRSRPEFRGKPIYMYDGVYFYDNYRVIIKLQNPDNQAYVDEYTYKDGYWSNPEPVKLSKSVDVQNEVVNLDKIPFKNAYNVYSALAKKYKKIGSSSNDFTIHANYYKNEINWHPQSISNQRSDYSIEYKEDGTLKSFEQK